MFSTLSPDSQSKSTAMTQQKKRSHLKAANAEPASSICYLESEAYAESAEGTLAFDHGTKTTQHAGACMWVI
jgi:hypothetical protein